MKTGYTVARIRVATGTINYYDISAPNFSQACKQAVELASRLSKDRYQASVVEVS